MKKLLSIVTSSALALALSTSGFAAEKKAKEKPASAPAAPAAVPEDGAKKPADIGSPKTDTKAMGMYVKVDAIDAKAKTFTHSNKAKGTEAAKEVKFVVTDKTDIKNGDAAAKFEDIKVGDTVSGSRIRKSENEYEVVKITKFGVAAPKEKKPESEKKPEEPKKP